MLPMFIFKIGMWARNVNVLTVFMRTKGGDVKIETFSSLMEYTNDVKQRITL